MIGSRFSSWALSLVVIDLLIILGAFPAAAELRAHGVGWIQPEFHYEAHYWILFLALGTQWIGAMAFRLYRPISEAPFFQLLKRYTWLGLVEVAVVGGAVFLFKAHETSRLFVASYISLAVTSQFLIRVVLRLIRHHFPSDTYNRQRILLVSDAPSSPPSKDFELTQIPLVAFNVTDLDRILSRATVDRVILDTTEALPTTFASVRELLDARGIPLNITLNFLSSGDRIWHLRELAGRPLLTAEPAILSPEARALKRFIDLIFGTIGLILTAALFPFISVWIKLDSSGPIFFRQIRVGHGGRRFTCYKFRTMVDGADLQKPNLESQNQMEGPIFKMEHDPRVTRVGRFLRKTSLDEFPQFFNIVKGEMSLIGTRPPTPEEVGRYETKDFRRISVKPGLTGLWQVSGRNSISKWEEILNLDLKYIDQWSPWLDLKIIFKTFLVLFSRKGAV